VTRSQYDALRGARGALLVSEPKRVVEKIRAFDESLGGISRLTFQMSIASLPHRNRMRAIELLGTKAVPELRSAGSLPTGNISLVDRAADKNV
jgi:hypothetical protein